MPSSFKDDFKKTDLIFLDLDGTLYLGDHLIEGALEFVEKARSCDKEIIFLSNNSSKSTSEYLPKLSSFGLCSDLNEIHNSLNATLNYLQSNQLNDIYVMASPSVEQEFSTKGFNLTASTPQAVVLTYDTTFNYQKFCTAIQHLRNGAEFIATHPDLMCPAPDGYLPDIGCLLQAFDTAGFSVVKVIGKPHITMIEPLLKSKNISTSQCMMIGDRMYTDIALANNSNMTSVLVFSGETKPTDLSDSPFKATHQVDSINTLVKLLD